MYMSNAVHVHTDIQVEIAPITSHVHQCLEKLMVSNTALKQLELSVICAGLYGNIYSWPPLCTELLPLPAQLTRKSVGGVVDSWIMVVLRF